MSTPVDTTPNHNAPVQIMRRVFDFPATEDTPAHRVTFTVTTTMHRVRGDDPDTSTGGFFEGRKLDPVHVLDSSGSVTVESTDEDGTTWKQHVRTPRLHNTDRAITMHRLRERTIARLAALSTDDAVVQAKRGFRYHNRATGTPPVGTSGRWRAEP